MDNLTHALIGISAAEVALAVKRDHSENKHFRKAVWFSSIAANNFPDLDFIYTPITEGRIGNLLHHRGHTHTIFFGIFEALLVYLITKSIYLKNDKSKNRSVILLMSFFGVLLHIFADSWNSYGVHPFWPIINRWFYGDFIFIIEPWIWVTLLPLAFYSVHTKGWKIFFTIVTFVAVFIFERSGMLSTPLLLGLCIILILNYFLGKKLTHKKHLFLQISFLVTILISFKIVSLKVHNQVNQNLVLQNDANNNWVTKDIVLSPLPANPICWMVQAVEVQNQSQYVIKQGVVSAFDSSISAQKCLDKMLQARVNFEPTISDGKKQLKIGADLVWYNEWKASLSEFELLKKNCVFNALLRFYRIPFWIKNQNGYYVGDARYDREKGTGFTEMQITESMSCPKMIPNWTIIRNDLSD